MGKGRNPRRKAGRDDLRLRVMARGEPCWICGLAIEGGREAGDPLAFELDELVPVSKGGDPVDYRNVAGAHRCCNQWRQAKSVAKVAAIRDETRRRFGSWGSPIEFCEKARAVKGKVASCPIKRPKRSSGAL